MDRFFGGKDPFDHPFFTQPYGGLFEGKSLLDDPFFNGKFDGQSGQRKQITIEELNPDDDDNDGDHDSRQKSMPSKDIFFRDSNEYPPGIHSFSYQSVAYGGPNGMSYTSSIGKRTGGDGLFLMEMKEDDRTIGESLHTISKGIHDKGHSVTTKQCMDGSANSLQTLHNLQEDELAGFEENWKVNADKVLPGWNNGFNLLENTGTSNSLVWDDFMNWGRWGGWPFPALEYSGNGGVESDNKPQGVSSSRSITRKNIPVE